MASMIDWAADLLISRGALVESEERGTLRAILSPELAGALGASEWLSLRFAAGAGSDDEADWLDRLGRLLPQEARVTGARLRRPRQAPAIDCLAALERELVVQNGIFRFLEDRPATARYYIFNFEYTIESDETSLGVLTVCLNASAGSLAAQPQLLLNAVRDNLEDDPEFQFDAAEMTRLFPIALYGAQPQIRRFAETIEQNANRRLARDAARVHSYYRDLLREIEKRISRRRTDAEAVAKERSRAGATELDRAAKLEDLARKYSLKIRIAPADVLVVSLPVLEISVRLIRKKAERPARFHWNPALGTLESPWCESCFGRAHPLYLCDGRLHFLCKGCTAACANCGRQFCRPCQPKCKCGAAPHA